MTVQTESIPSSTFRNFNICPHCQYLGKEGLLCRMCEGVPMISRSDGKCFHLLLADQPLPYPAERGGERSDLVSVCFWYAHAGNGHKTRTSVVVLPGKKRGYAAFFRKVEQAADLLMEKLKTSSQLSSLYELHEEVLVEAIV